MASLSEVPRKAVGPTLAEKIDRYGDLDLLIQQFTPKQEEHDLLKKEIEESTAGEKAERGVVRNGARWEVQFSARPRERTIVSPVKAYKVLRKLLGLEGFLSLVTIPLGEGVDKHIPKSLHPSLVVSELTGTRRMKLVPKFPPEAAGPPELA